MKRLKPPTFVQGVVVVGDCHDFRILIVRIVSVSNVKSPKDCLCNRKKMYKILNWFKTHPKVANAQHKCLFHHFWGMLAL